MNPRRLWAVVATLCLGGVLVVGRAAQIMVVDHQLWAQRARNQQRRVISVPGQRGTIRSADGYVLATSVDRVAIQVNTLNLRYPDLFVASAAAALGHSEESLRSRLAGRPRTLWLAQRAERDTGEAVRALAPAAVVLVPDSQRLYPLGSTASPVVGFVGREELATVGRAGLEHCFDDLLRGTPEEYLAVHDAVQRQLRLERLHTGRAGYDIDLTLNARLQAACEAELERAVSSLNARSASAVVLEAHSGDLLALASMPSFDPSAPGDVPPARWRLRAVQDAFEPGSTVKPLVAAAALAAGAIQPGEVFDCRDRGIEVAGVWIRDHADPGLYTIDQVVAQSANAGIIAAARRLPERLLWQTMDAFGFGRRTGLGFPAETSGILMAPRRWSRLSFAGLAIGQELTVSPLQLALAYAAIANGGWLPRPRLVQRATAAEGTANVAQRWRRRVMDSSLAARVAHMLELVVTEGTGEAAGLSAYRVAGKTGTAQRPVDGRFDDTHHVAWFAGFCPMPDPRFVIVVAVEEPRADFWASQVAAPLFGAIAAATAQLYELPRSRPQGRDGGRGGAA